MADILSQSEVESLLAALGPAAGGDAVDPHARRIASSRSAIRHDAAPRDGTSRGAASGLEAALEGFGRGFATGLSALVRDALGVRFVALDRMSFGEFVASIENSTCVNLIKAESFDLHLVLALSPAIVFPLLDRLLGGGRAPLQSLPPQRPLTEIEQRIVGRIADLAMQSLASVWKGDSAAKFYPAQSASRQQVVQQLRDEDVVGLATFEVSIREHRGLMNLCIPSKMIEPSLADRLPAAGASSPAQNRLEGLHSTAGHGAGGAGRELTVVLAGTRLSAGELAGLSVGDTIVTGDDCREPLEIRIDGQPGFRGFVGVVQGRKAVRIHGTAVSEGQ